MTNKKFQNYRGRTHLKFVLHWKEEKGWWQSHDPDFQPGGGGGSLRSDAGRSAGGYAQMPGTWRRALTESLLLGPQSKANFRKRLVPKIHIYVRLVSFLHCGRPGLGRTPQQKGKVASHRLQQPLIGPLFIVACFFKEQLFKVK